MSQGDEAGTVHSLMWHPCFHGRGSVARTKFFPRYMLHDAESQLDLCLMNRRKRKPNFAECRMMCTILATVSALKTGEH